MLLAVNGFDQYWLSFFHSLPDAYTPFFFLVTQFGDSLLLIMASAFVFVLGKKDVRALAAVLIIGLLVGNIVMGDIKDLIKRPRPEGPKIQDYLASVSFAFPSGHAVTAFVAASIVGGYLGWKYRIGGYLLAALIAISRLYLVVHYATDVIAGALIGVFIGETAILLAYRLGICKNIGLFGLLPVRSKLKHVIVKDSTVAGRFANSAWYYFVIASALVLSMIALFSGYLYIAIALILVIPAFIIISTEHQILTENAELMIAFFAILTGLIAAFLAYIFASYLLSLLIITGISLVLFWFTHPKKTHHLAAKFNET
ncbi:MAG TPA: phosphatase PAP2 family protein [Methanocella sp.]|jgi:undecaprenyl-diphosphatase